MVVSELNEDFVAAAIAGGEIEGSIKGANDFVDKHICLTCTPDKLTAFLARHENDKEFIAKSHFYVRIHK